MTLVNRSLQTDGEAISFPTGVIPGGDISLIVDSTGDLA